MDAVKFMDSDLVDLPKTRPDGDFLEYARTLLSEYRRSMDEVPKTSLVNQVITTRSTLVEEASSHLVSCIDAYYNGHPATAYDWLDKCLTVLGPHFDVLCPASDMSTLVNPMFRMRNASTNPYARGDLFHIPFHLRHIVAPMRYSINGLPCLYLGGSTYVCWKELGEPDLSGICVSRVEAVEGTNLKVLNFGRRPAVLAAWIDTKPEDFTSLNNAAAVLGSFVACWPLLALCSIRKLHARAAFHPEYIVPQLVLQWITNTRQFHGVRYFSTHYTEYHDDPKTYMNYVFPTRHVQPDGYCPELVDLFRITEPTLWNDAKAKKAPDVARPQYKYRGGMLADLEAEFGHIERILISRDAEHL